MGLALTRLVGVLMRDVALTRDEVVGTQGWVAHIWGTADRHDQAERLAGRERGRARETVRVRAAA